jgi:hypothetical protein
MSCRFLTVAALAILMGCQTVPTRENFGCSEEQTADWHIPAGWCLRELTPEEAYTTVITGNLPMDAIRDRWEALQTKWRSGDRYLFYRRPEQPWLNDLGAQEGVVLIRGCDQLGFVTTSVATGTPQEN